MSGPGTGAGELAALEGDALLTCRTCDQSFPFTAAERDFYVAKGLVNLPRHCKPCRDARKRSAEATKKGERHPSDCSSCGSPTTVPFIPDGRRPVYCPGCYPRRRAAA